MGNISYPFPWTSSGMRLFAKVLDFHASVSCRLHERCVRPYARMSHQRDIHVVIRVCSSIEETNFASTTLCSKENQLPSPVTRDAVSPSAGVPNNTTLPPKLSFLTTSAAASAAPSEATAIKLCPQACPRPGRASVSAVVSHQSIHAIENIRLRSRSQLTHHTQH